MTFLALTSDKGRASEPATAARQVARQVATSSQEITRPPRRQGGRLLRDQEASEGVTHPVRLAERR